MGKQSKHRNETPPPVPESEESSEDREDGYGAMAETVGLVPTFRALDHAIQGLTTFLGLVVGAIGGALIAKGSEYEGGIVWGAFMGGVFGTLVGLFMSGFALMILGWVRAIMRLNR